MKYRAALATLDGEEIDVHFGRCGNFLVAEIDADTGEAGFIERREVAPVCPSGHDDEVFCGVADALSDCRFVIAARAGLYAKRYMKSKGLIIIEDPSEVSDALKKLAAHLKYAENMQKVSDENGD
ncbi:MAG: hypothetical protein LBP62_04370 [Clostridiales bacterium]|jgi:predicted Fe-Mo cluster-binding NifX family protein|nr:hypothetical protein [Clostridiales bacterium]